MDVILVWVTVSLLFGLFLVVAGMVIDCFINDDWDAPFEDDEEDDWVPAWRIMDEDA